MESNYIIGHQFYKDHDDNTIQNQKNSESTQEQQFNNQEWNQLDSQKENNDLNQLINFKNSAKNNQIQSNSYNSNLNNNLANMKTETSSYEDLQQFSLLESNLALSNIFSHKKNSDQIQQEQINGNNTSENQEYSINSCQNISINLGQSPLFSKSINGIQQQNPLDQQRSSEIKNYNGNINYTMKLESCQEKMEEEIDTVNENTNQMQKNYSMINNDQKQQNQLNQNDKFQRISSFNIQQQNKNQQQLNCDPKDQDSQHKEDKEQNFEKINDWLEQKGVSMVQPNPQQEYFDVKKEEVNLNFKLLNKNIQKRKYSEQISIFNQKNQIDKKNSLDNDEILENDNDNIQQNRKRTFSMAANKMFQQRKNRILQQKKSSCQIFDINPKTISTGSKLQDLKNLMQQN